ncbi:uncharacterized protein LOC109846199 [Asparagus officinalis]|uniref:uncharacterized protein LOC109846199 n=1 Tax=Asparagus officinalis TaxID=4686 RepID=UPI00098E2942|nr:uncharacterized protein LOC109846199 [Asparagus officinalis]
MARNYIRDKDWMYVGRAERMQSIFVNGVSAFMDFGLTNMSGVPSRSKSRRLLQRGDLQRQVRERRRELESAVDTQREDRQRQVREPRRELESAHVATAIPSIGESTPVRDIDANQQTPTQENDLQTTPPSHSIPSGQSSGQYLLHYLLVINVLFAKKCLHNASISYIILKDFFTSSHTQCRYTAVYLQIHSRYTLLCICSRYTANGTHEIHSRYTLLCICSVYLLQIHCCVSAVYLQIHSRYTLLCIYSRYTARYTAVCICCVSADTQQIHTAVYLQQIHS